VQRDGPQGTALTAEATRKFRGDLLDMATILRFLNEQLPSGSQRKIDRSTALKTTSARLCGALATFRCSSQMAMTLPAYCAGLLSWLPSGQGFKTHQLPWNALIFPPGCRGEALDSSIA
jgi:hypothetical protein